MTKSSLINSAKNIDEASARSAAIITVLQQGSVRGSKQLASLASGNDDLPRDVAALRSWVDTIQTMIACGIIAAQPDRGSVLFHLHDAHASSASRGNVFRRRFYSWHTLFAVAAISVGCTSTVAPPSRVPLMPYPSMTGLQQVVDPVSGAMTFQPCNPCSAPTPKTDFVTAPIVTPPSTDADSEPQPVPPPIRVIEPDVIQTFWFQNASSALTPLSRQTVNKLIPLALHAQRIEIVGYTDSTGTPAINNKIAKARAVIVQRELVNAGVSAERVSVDTCITCYVAENKTSVGRAANRRTEITLKF